MRQRLLTLAIILLLGLAPLAGGPVSAEVVDRIVATVNGEIITLQEVEGRLKPFLVAKGQGITPGQVDELRRQILETMINQILTLQEAERQKIEVNDEAVDEAIARIKKDNKFTQEEFEKKLSEKGVSMVMFREDLRVDMIRHRLIRREVTGLVAVPDEEVDAFLLEQKGLDANDPGRVQLRNILIAIPSTATDEERRTKKEAIESVKDEIEDGLDFAEAARKYSEAPNAAKGGDLGSVSWSYMDPKVRDALKDTEEGEVCGPLEVGGAFQLFKVVKIQNDGVSASDEERDAARKELTDQRLKERYEEFFRRLRDKARIKINL